MVCRETSTISDGGGGGGQQASQFYITTADNIDSLDEKHTIFGEVAEGMDVLMKINGEYVDDKNRPYINIRLKHCVVLDDPFPDPQGLEDLIPDGTPETFIDKDDNRLEDDWRPAEETKTAEEIEKSMRKSEAKSRAVVLEMIGDIPDADAKPPDEFLFVCKLNPVTSDEDLEIIFSRFGKITSCDVIRDKKTGESLNYAFIGFDKKEDAERAYFKMDGVLIDDRRIKVDFSQSMHHLWKQYRSFGKHGGSKSAVSDEIRGADDRDKAQPRRSYTYSANEKGNLRIRDSAVAGYNVMPSTYRANRGGYDNSQGRQENSKRVSRWEPARSRERYEDSRQRGKNNYHYSYEQAKSTTRRDRERSPDRPPYRR